jgi:hypothetical protein
MGGRLTFAGVSNPLTAKTVFTVVTRFRPIRLACELGFLGIGANRVLLSWGNRWQPTGPWWGRAPLRSGSRITSLFSDPLSQPLPKRAKGCGGVILEPFLSWLSP